MPSPAFRHRPPVRQICEKEADSAGLSLGPLLLLYNHFGGLFQQLAHSLVGPLSTACTMCRSSLLRVFMCLCDLDSDRRGCLALGTILARVPSGQTSGSDFLVAHTQLADHNQCRDNAICVSPGPMKIYLHHGREGHDMAHILASCPLGTNASVGRNLFVRCTRALVHSNAAHGGQKTDGQEETRLGILRPYKVLQWKVLNDLIQKAV